MAGAWKPGIELAGVRTFGRSGEFPGHTVGLMNRCRCPKKERLRGTGREYRSNTGILIWARLGGPKKTLA